MSQIENKDTRYFVEIGLDGLELIRVGTDQKHLLAKGQQTTPGVHRLFLSKGQYSKFIDRCGSELQHVLDT